MKRLSLLVPALLALAASDDSGSTAEAAAPPQPVVQLAPDAFYTRVLGIVAASADYSEAPAIDTIVATTPEDREPLAL
jgi:hypothetical protein